MRRALGLTLVFAALAIGPTTDRGPEPPSELPGSSPLLEALDCAALELTRQSPETVTARGLATQLGVRNDALDGVALDTTGEGYAPIESALAQIADADLAGLASRDRWAVEAFDRWLRDILDGRPYQVRFCPVSTYLTSYPQRIARFMESIHPLGTKADAEDYLSRLSQIPERFEDLAGRLAATEAAGALAPRFLLLRGADQIDALGQGPAETSVFYRRFALAIQAMTDVGDDERQDLLDQALHRVSDNVLPAYDQLADAVRTFAARASDDVGVWRQKDGEAYYAYLLRTYTTAEMTAAETYSLGLREVERLQAEIRTAAASLGYDPNMPLPSLFARLREDSGVVVGDATVGACRELIAAVADLTRAAFPDWPDRPLTVEAGGSTAHFVEGTDDGSRPGIFFVPVEQVRPMYSIPSLVYHEAIPGHFLQMAIARDAGLPRFLGDVSFSGYTEGWAVYAERLAWELGAYAGDPLGNIGRLQEELFRAARLVVDPGIHAMRWTYDEAVRYMVGVTGLSEATVRDEVDRYVVAPGQATAYGVGLCRLLGLRERARAELGPAFDLAEFHRTVLSCGSVPFAVLEAIVDEFVASRRRFRDAAMVE